MDCSRRSENLEDRLRGMIHSSNASNASSPISSPQLVLPPRPNANPVLPQNTSKERRPQGPQPGPVSKQNTGQAPGPQNRRQGRPNQAQRRHIAANVYPDLVSRSFFPTQQRPAANVAQYQVNLSGDIGVNEGHQKFKSDHVRDVVPGRQTLPERTPNVGMRQKGFSRQSHRTPQPASDMYGRHARGFGQYQMQSSRPLPQYMQLYDPASDHGQRALYDHQEQTAIKAQTSFLDETVWAESQAFTISSEELSEKARLESRLREICCGAVVEHESKKSAAFPAGSVHLECFGSVGTGFAMPHSDMDLAVLSPLSRPEPRAADSPIPRLLEKALLEAGYGARLLTKTRVPIIRFCEKPTDELRSAILEARTIWEAEEKERLLNPKPEPKKNNRKKHRKAESTAKESDGSQSESSSLAGSTQASFDTKSGKAQSEGASTNTSVGNNAETNGEVKGKKADVLKDPNAEKQEPKPFVIETEGEDEDAPTRSDQERIRLYKLAMQDGWYLPPERRIIHNFIYKVNKASSPNGSDELLQARLALKALPNILKRHRVHVVNPLDYPKSGVGIQCDINFSNFLALHNTKLLYCYSLCDPRVKVMVLFVKSWAKRRKINSPYHGTLSSYGYVLMVLHYLINVVKPPVLPNLQHVPAAMIDHPDNISELEGYNVRFWRDEAAIAATVQRGQMNSNTESIGSLLRGFFQYFGTNNPPYSFDWMTQVLSLRTIGGIVTKQSKGWKGAKTVTIETKNQSEEKKEVRHRYLFAIEDPFETDHNVARTVVHNGIVAIRNEFRRAVAVIGSIRFEGAKAKEELMAEAEDREYLQFKPFGHPPRGYGQSKPPTAAVSDTGHGKAIQGDGNSSVQNPSVVTTRLSAAVEELQKQVSQLNVLTCPAETERRDDTAFGLAKSAGL